ncbi:Transcription factor MYB1R1 [Glycine soja]|nr:Transcription factor MYB1R1 [Glycine soja]
MLSSGSSQSIHSKKYIHWTKEEHRSFLLGLEEYKESRWEKISEKFVPSKTPTQVVSHAKKFFKWKNAPKKERKRRSIHETTLDDIDMIVTPHIDQHNWLPPPPNFAV